MQFLFTISFDIPTSVIRIEGAFKVVDLTAEESGDILFEEVTRNVG